MTEVRETLGPPLLLCEGHPARPKLEELLPIFSVRQNPICLGGGHLGALPAGVSFISVPSVASVAEVPGGPGKTWLMS